MKPGIDKGMKLKKLYLYLLLFSTTFVIENSVRAQDSTKKRSIDITSTFKPVLKETAKINFTASAPAADTSRAKLTYNIPVQNLLFAYQPAELNPVALNIDSINAWEYSN